VQISGAVAWVVDQVRDDPDPGSSTEALLEGITLGASRQFLESLSAEVGGDADPNTTASDRSRRRSARA
jgi:hypothetical protein